MQPLKEMHTRELLKLLDMTRKFNGRASLSDSSCGPFYYYDDIKTELNTREHIPNKAEAKKLRQQKALKKRHR